MYLCKHLYHRIDLILIVYRLCKFNRNRDWIGNEISGHSPALFKYLPNRHIVRYFLKITSDPKIVKECGCYDTQALCKWIYSRPFDVYIFSSHKKSHPSFLSIWHWYSLESKQPRSMSHYKPALCDRGNRIWR